MQGAHLRCYKLRPATASTASIEADGIRTLDMPREDSKITGPQAAQLLFAECGLIERTPLEPKPLNRLLINVLRHRGFPSRQPETTRHHIALAPLPGPAFRDADSLCATDGSKCRSGQHCSKEHRRMFATSAIARHRYAERFSME